MKSVLFMLFLIEEIEKWNEINDTKINENNRAFMELAYTIFFFGVDEISKGFKENFAYKHSLHTPFIIHFLNSLKRIRKDNLTKDEVYELSAGSTEWYPTYKPFEGHVSKLGHYYRHLYQLIKFVTANENIGFGFKEKYEFIKTVRAQLSNHEQVLIYFQLLF
ncbi:MAG: putative phage abortive infection protein [Cytophagales bacterium]|nr:putative phage abortive infection protein [Cytophagales bacterium]